MSHTLTLLGRTGGGIYSGRGFCGLKLLDLIKACMIVNNNQKIALYLVIDVGVDLRFRQNPRNLTATGSCDLREMLRFTVTAICVIYFATSLGVNDWYLCFFGA